jgi:hypothetical protein
MPPNDKPTCHRCGREPNGRTSFRTHADGHTYCGYCHPEARAARSAAGKITGRRIQLACRFAKDLPDDYLGTHRVRLDADGKLRLKSITPRETT